MNSAGARCRAMMLFLCIAGGAQGLPLHASFGASADDAGGTSIDAELSLSPSERFSLSVGAGHSSGSDETGNLSGTLLDVGASLHGERFGISTDFSSFDDSSNYRAHTFAARAWIAAGDFEIALLGRHRDLGVELTLELPLRTVRREAEFSGTGGGLQLSFARGDFNAYAMALRYDYDDALEQFIALSNSPQLALRPRIEALVGSFMTQAQGAIDRQAAAGIERGFGRHAFALDVATVHDVILDSGSVSFALTYRHTRSSHFDWSIATGVVDSDAFGSTAFAGVTLGLAN